MKKHAFLVVFALVAAIAATITAARAGSWVVAADLNQARTAQGSVMLLDGRPMVVGGSTPSGQLTATTEVYDPATGDWLFTGNLSRPQWPGRSHVAALQDGRVLLAGGSDISLLTATDSAEIYDPTTGLWTPTGSLNTARRSHPLVGLDDGSVLSIGGSRGGPASDRFYSSCERFDPVSEAWSYTGSLHIAREGHTAVKLDDGSVLVVGGEGPWLVHQPPGS